MAWPGPNVAQFQTGRLSSVAKTLAKALRSFGEIMLRVLRFPMV
jgi:hypothetical protein